MKISEFMVPNPTCARRHGKPSPTCDEPCWLTIIRCCHCGTGKCSDTGQWQVVRSEELAAYLLVENEDRKKERNKQTLACAIAEGDEKLQLHCVKGRRQM